MNKRNMAAGVALGLIGFAGNWFKLELFYSVDLLFGSFFVMLAILRYGTVAGIIAGIIAGSCSYLLWNHPWAVVIFAGEALFVAWRERRHPTSVITSDILYWVCCGVPLVWVFYHHVMGIQVQATVLIMLKQAINGVFCALLATLAHLAIQARLGDKDRLLSFRQIIFVAMVSLTLIPAFIMFTYHFKGYMESEQKRLIGMTHHAAELTRQSINRLLNDRRDSAGIDYARISGIITSIGGELNVQVTLLDRNSRVIASTRPNLTVMTRFSMPAGGATHLEEGGVYHWLPALAQGTSTMQRWGASLFVREEALDPDIGWTVRAETPLRPLLGKLSSETITLLLLMSLLVMATVFLSALISRKLVQSLRQLKDVTQALPGEFLSEMAAQEWPVSRVAEMDGLIDNFKQMTYAVYISFAELKKLNETLEQRVAERTEELSESVARYRLLAENANDLIFRYRLFPDYVCLYTSPSSVRLLGYTPEEFYTDTELPFKLVHPDDRTLLEQVRSGMAFPSGYLLRWIHREGRTVWLDTRLTVVTPPDSSFVEIIGISRDVTDLKLREALAVELEEEKIRVGAMEKEERYLRETEMLVKDLHDGIGGIVTNIAMLGQYALLQGDAKQSNETLARIVGLASEGMTEVRSFMNSIARGESAWSDLLAEIKDHAERMLGPHAIRLDVSANIVEMLPPIGPFRYVNIIRICREIIANIIKHSGARSVKLIFLATTEQFELCLEDDGGGYDPDIVKKRGLADMRTRAREIGADFSVASSSTGTSVSLVLLLPH